MPLFRRLKRACLTLFNSFCFPGSWLMSQGFPSYDDDVGPRSLLAKNLLMTYFSLSVCRMLPTCHEAQLEIFRNSTLLCENFSSSFIFILSFGGGYI